MECVDTWTQTRCRSRRALSNEYLIAAIGVDKPSSTPPIHPRRPRSKFGDEESSSGDEDNELSQRRKRAASFSCTQQRRRPTAFRRESGRRHSAERTREESWREDRGWTRSLGGSLGSQFKFRCLEKWRVLGLNLRNFCGLVLASFDTDFKY